MLAWFAPTRCHEPPNELVHHVSKIVGAWGWPTNPKHAIACHRLTGLPPCGPLCPAACRSGLCWQGCAADRAGIVPLQPGLDAWLMEAVAAGQLHDGAAGSKLVVADCTGLARVAGRQADR